jgi:histidine triad (HIT) family protein
MINESIFTKIINGDIPSHKIFESDKIIAFLDIHPIRPGHALVVPKVQVDHFDDLDNDYYQEVFEVVKRVAKAQKLELGAKRVCLRVEGFDVPHAHVHVYPCNVASDFYNDNRATNSPSSDELAEIAQKLANRIQQ